MSKIWTFLQPAYRLWLKFGKILAIINSTLLLTLFYFVVITPVGLIRKLFGNDGYGKGESSASMWHTKVVRKADLETYSKQY